jgi:hypothetical protein
MDAGVELATDLAAARDCCRDLAAALDEERRAVARWDLAALLAAIRARELVQERWLRQAAVREVLSGGAPAPAAGPAGARGRDHRDELRREVAALARAQRINAAIVRGALDAVSGLIGVLRRARSGSRYDARAALTAPSSPGRQGWSA